MRHGGNNRTFTKTKGLGIRNHCTRRKAAPAGKAMTAPAGKARLSKKASIKRSSGATSQDLCSASSQLISKRPSATSSQGVRFRTRRSRGSSGAHVLIRVRGGVWFVGCPPPQLAGRIFDLLLEICGVPGRTMQGVGSMKHGEVYRAFWA